MAGLPDALNTDQRFYAHHAEQLGRIAGLLAEQNELLRQVLDARQAGQPQPPEQPAGPGPVAVKLREPEPPRSPEPEPSTTALREPEPTLQPKPTRTARGGRRSPKASN